MHVSRNIEANSSWIAKKLLGKLKYDPEMKLDAMYDELVEKYSVDVGRMQLYRAKRKAME